MQLKVPSEHFFPSFRTGHFWRPVDIFLSCCSGPAERVFKRSHLHDMRPLWHHLWFRCVEVSKSFWKSARYRSKCEDFCLKLSPFLLFCATVAKNVLRKRVDLCVLLSKALNVRSVFPFSERQFIQRLHIEARICSLGNELLEKFCLVVLLMPRFLLLVLITANSKQYRLQKHWCSSRSW